MQAVTTIGIDIAKSVFQVHGMRRGRQGDHPPSTEAPLRLGVLREAAYWLGSRAAPRRIIGRASSRHADITCA